MAKSEVDRVAEIIVRSHGGKAMFNLTQAAKVLGQGKNSIARYLQEEGVIVKKVGQEKLVSALQLAEFMCGGRISPLDGTSRGLTLGAAAGVKPRPAEGGACV